MIVVSQLQETDRIKFYENLREDKFVGRLGTLLSSGESAEAKYQRICSEIIDGNIPDTNDDVQKIKRAFLRIPSIAFLLKVSGANERIAPGLSRLQKLGQRLHNLHLPESLNQEELIALFRALPEEYQKQISAQMKAIIFKSASLEAAASARKSDDIEFYLPNAYQSLMFPYLVDALFSIPEIAKVIALTQPDSISPQAIQALQSNLISKGKLAYLTNIWPANGPLNTPTEISSYIQKIEAFFSNITREGQETMRSQLYTHLLKDIPQGDVSKQQFTRAFNQFVQEFRLQNITLNSEPLIEFARRGDRNIAALYESCQRERSKSSKH